MGQQHVVNRYRVWIVDHPRVAGMDTDYAMMVLLGSFYVSGNHKTNSNQAQDPKPRYWLF